MVAGLVPELLFKQGVKIDATSLHVLVVMLGFTRKDDDPPVCFASQGAIEDRSRMTTRSIRRALDRLAAAGLIELRGTVGGRHREARGRNVYAIKLPHTQDRVSDTSLSDTVSDRDSTGHPVRGHSVRKRDRTQSPIERPDTVSDRSSQVNPKRSRRVDDDDSAAGQTATPGGAPAVAAALSENPAEPNALTLMVMRDLDMTADQAARWIATKKINERAKSTRIGYARTCIDNQLAAEAESAAKPAGKPAKPAKATRVKSAAKAAAPSRAVRTVPACRACQASAAGSDGLCTACRERHRRAVQPPVRPAACSRDGCGQPSRPGQQFGHLCAQHAAGQAQRQADEAQRRAASPSIPRCGTCNKPLPAGRERGACDACFQQILAYDPFAPRRGTS